MSTADLSSSTIWPATPSTPPPGARMVADVVDVDLMANRTFAAGVPHEAFDELRRHGGVAWQVEPPVAGSMEHGDAVLGQRWHEGAAGLRREPLLVAVDLGHQRVGGDHPEPGEPTRMASNFINGIVDLPVRL